MVFRMHNWNFQEKNSIKEVKSWNGESCRAITMCFWFGLINLISKDTYKVFIVDNWNFQE